MRLKCMAILATLCAASALGETSSAMTLSGARVEAEAGESLISVRDKVRAMTVEERASSVEVVLASGEYCLPEGMELASQDGGVVWRAEKPGTARIVGAPRIPPSAFRKVVNPNVLARLPEGGRGRVYAADVSAYCPKEIPDLDNSFSGVPRPPSVFIDGNLAPMSAYPNDGAWMTFSRRVDIGAPIPGKREQFTGGAFVCDDPQLKRWDFSNGVWLNGYFCHDWHNWSVKAVSYSEENGTNDVVRIAPGVYVPYGIMGTGTWGRKERRFRAFNLFEELDAPGEWWLDRRRKILFIVPPDGVMKDTTDVRISFATRSLIFGDKVCGLRFEGLEFAFCHSQLAHFVGAGGIEFRGCRFSCTAKNAVEIEEGVGRNLLSGCEIVHCGAGGVKIDDGDRRTLTPAGSAVENCRIHDFGMLQRTYSCAVEAKGCGIAVRGCEIFDAPHMAMRYEANDCVIESNDIHHVLLETGDAGAIYSGRDWTTQGNVVCHNFIHDIGAGTTAKEGEDDAVSGTNAMGLYFDDCDCGDEVYGNVFLNCPRGILIGGGRDHPVRSNVFVNCRMGMSIDCRGISWKGKWNVAGTSSDLEGKAKKFGYTSGVWAARYPRLANIMDDHPMEPLYNPVEDNMFIDCGEVLKLDRVLKLNDDGSAPGMLSRMAPIRGNTVIYTKGAVKVPRQQFDLRIAGGFRVLDNAATE